MTQSNLTKCLLALGVLLLSLVVGCQDSDKLNPEQRGGKPITFSSNIQLQPTNSFRVQENIWDKDDLISVYMIKSGTKLDANTSANDLYYTGAKYKAANRGAKVFFDAFTEEDKMFFPETGTVDFIAYYPATLEADANKSLQLDMSANPVDLLYSNELKAKSSSTNSEELCLPFSHALSCIRIALTSNFDELYTAKSISMEGLSTKATFSLTDGTISNVGGMGKQKFTPRYDRYYDAIVIPQQIVEGNVTVSINFQEVPYTFTLPAGEIKAGQRIVYTLELSEGGTPAPISGKIESWDEINGGEATLATSGNHTGVNPELTEHEKSLLAVWKKKFGFDLTPFIGTMICNGTVRENGQDLIATFSTPRIVDVRNQKMTVEISKQATEDQPILSFTKNALGLANYWRDVYLLLTWENREFWNDPRHPYVAPAVKEIVKKINWTEDTYVEFDVAMPIIKVDTSNKGVIHFTGTKVEAVTGLMADANHTLEQLEEKAKALDPVFELYYESTNLDNALQFDVPLFKKAVEMAKDDFELYDAIQQASFSPFQIMDTKTIGEDTWKDDIEGSTQYEEPKGTIDFSKKEIHIRTISSLENSGYTLIDITCRAI